MQKAMRLRVCCPVVHNLLRGQLHPQIRKLLPSQPHRGLSVRTQAVQQQAEVHQERRHAAQQSSKQSGLNCAILLPHNTEVRGVMKLISIAGMPAMIPDAAQSAAAMPLLGCLWKDSFTMHLARSTQL